MKSPILFTLICMLSSSLWAAEAKTMFISPDGKYGVRMGKEDSEMRPFNLIRVKTGEVLCELDSVDNSYRDQFRLVWAPDSQRAASYSPDRRGGETRLFVRAGSTFQAVVCPDMPELEPKHPREGGRTVTLSWGPVRWSKANVLLIDHENTDDDGFSIKQQVVLTFNARNEITVTGQAITERPPGK